MPGLLGGEDDGTMSDQDVLRGEIVEERGLARLDEVGAAELALVQRRMAQQVLAQMLVRSGEMSRDEKLQRWSETIASWVANQKSRHSQSAYRLVADLWLEFIGADPWLVSERRRVAYRQKLLERAEPRLEAWDADIAAVLRWQRSLEEAGKSANTVAHRLACMASLYSFVIQDVRTDEVGVERSLFTDSAGQVRFNPFRSEIVKRPDTENLAPPQPLSKAAVQAMLDSCNVECRTGARNFALLRTFVLTGWRSDEVLSMTWGRLRENPKFAGEWLYLWKGKGGKSQWEPLPASCYHAIVHYLKVDGRWPVVDDEMFLWQPIHRHGALNFGADLEALKGMPISNGQANNILRKHLKGVVRDPKLFHVHSLRHTHADQVYEARSDIRVVQKRLHHSSPATTARYLQRMEAPQDDFSRQLELQLGI